jgi:hypothetical protein
MQDIYQHYRPHASSSACRWLVTRHFRSNFYANYTFLNSQTRQGEGIVISALHGWVVGGGGSGVCAGKYEEKGLAHSFYTPYD